MLGDSSITTLTLLKSLFAEEPTLEAVWPTDWSMALLRLLLVYKMQVVRVCCALPPSNFLEVPALLAALPREFLLAWWPPG